MNDKAITIDGVQIPIQKLKDAGWTPPLSSKNGLNTLSEANWQRVIDEGYYCRFSRADGIGFTRKLRAYNPEDIYPFTSTEGMLYTCCEIVRKPNIIQPWFGGVFPEYLKDKQLTVYYRSGTVFHHTIYPYADEFVFDDNSTSAYDVIAFIIHEGIKPNVQRRNTGD